MTSAVFSALPETWTTAQVGEVAKISYGKALRAEDRAGAGGIPVYGSGGVVGEHDQALHSGPSIVIGRKGTVGAVYYTPGPFWCIDTAFYLEKISPSVDPEYLAHILRFIDLSRLVIVVGVPGINRKQIENERIPLPTLPEQRRIVEILRQADDVRRLRRRSNERAQELLPALFNEMFGDPATNPKGWEFEKIGALVDVKTGGTPSRKTSEYFGGQIPWVKTTEVVGTIIYDTEEKITHQGLESSNCELFPVNTILVAMYGQGLTRGRTAKLGIPATTNQACAALLPSPKINSDFLWSYLQLSYDRLRDLGRGGNQPNLNLSIIKDFGIFLPPFPLQEEFASRLEQIQATQKKQDQSYQRFGDLFQSLLAQAFSGVLTSAWREAHQAELIPATSALEVVTKMAISPIEVEAVDVVVGQDKAVVEAAVASPSVAGLRDLILEAAAKHLRRYWTLMDLTGLPRLNNLPRNAVREAIDMLVVLGQVRQAYLRADEPDIPQGYVEAYTLVRDEELIKADEIEL